MDPLGRQAVQFDWPPAGSLSPPHLPDDRVSWVRLDSRGGSVPVVEAVVGPSRRRIRVAVDTGASVNYLDDLAVTEGEATQLHQDFDPGDLSPFGTRATERVWEVGGRSHSGVTAELPTALASQLARGGLHGILGLPFLTRQRLILDVPRARIGFEKG